jgi:hypothetical protein
MSYVEGQAKHAAKNWLQARVRYVERTSHMFKKLVWRLGCVARMHGPPVCDDIRGMQTCSILYCAHEELLLKYDKLFENSHHADYAQTLPEKGSY